MQVKLIALAVAGLMAAPVFAQSNVTLYGRVDMAYTNLTNDDKGAVLDQESSNRWGLMGEEDLGGGMKAFFQLENRFFLDNGNTDPGNAGSGNQWKDKAWVGLAGNFGRIYLGRNASAGYATYGGSYEAFGGDTIGQFAGRRAKVVSIWNNSIRYDTPTWGPVQLIGTYGLNEEAAGGAAAYAGGLKFALGNFRADLLYQHDVGDNGGGPLVQTRMFNTTYLAAGYSFGTWDLFGGYALSKGYDKQGTCNENAEMVRYQVGVKVPLGNGSILANVGRGTEKTRAAACAAGVTDVPAFNHVGLGYWHALSKRTTLMANLKYDRQRDKYANSEDNQTGLELGIRHSF